MNERTHQARFHYSAYIPPHRFHGVFFGGNILNMVLYISDHAAPFKIWERAAVIRKVGTAAYIFDGSTRKAVDFSTDPTSNYR